MAYDNDNRGAVWGNRKKEKDTHPDFTGNATIGGVDYFVDAWKRKPDAPDKAPALSFKFKRKDKQGGQREAPKAARPAVDPEFDDGLPFAWAIALPLLPLLMAVADARQSAGIV